jgi:putative transcriptional regulator
MSADTIQLAHHFLVAMPSMDDGTFSGAVIYVCEHNDQGALGIIINRPMEMAVQDLFSRIDLTLASDDQAAQPVYFGGPVQTERGFVLHPPMPEETSYIATLKVKEGLEMTTSRDILEDVAAGRGPDRFLLALGYAGWAAGQLESEIAQNGWLTMPADPKVIFSVSPAERFNAALSLLGFDPVLLSAEVGHA